MPVQLYFNLNHKEVTREALRLNLNPTLGCKTALIQAILALVPQLRNAEESEKAGLYEAAGLSKSAGGLYESIFNKLVECETVHPDDVVTYAFKQDMLEVATTACRFLADASIIQAYSWPFPNEVCLVPAVLEKASG